MSAARSAEAWIAYHTPRPRARLRLFCFPYAGGGAAAFRAWGAELPPQIEVFPIQLPGREARLQEPPFTRLLPLVQTLAALLRPYCDRPVALFGHSLGALIAFELARYLRRQDGLQPVHLFVSAHRAPQLPIPSAALIHRLPDAAFKEHLRHLGGTPEAVLRHPELMDLLLPVLRADFTVYETYEYAAELPLPCPISAFGGLHDPDVSRADLALWQEQTPHKLTLRMFPGGHFFLHDVRQQVLSLMLHDLGPVLHG